MASYFLLVGTDEVGEHDPRTGAVPPTAPLFSTSHDDGEEEIVADSVESGVEGKSTRSVKFCPKTNPEEAVSGCLTLGDEPLTLMTGVWMDSILEVDWTADMTETEDDEETPLVSGETTL